MADNSIRLKGRLLFLAQYLMEHTDDRHKITTEELIDFFEKNGYRANRNTVHDDMVVLAECGIDIVAERYGKGKAYYVGNRWFDLSEVKMIVDAISSSGFISAEKSKELIDKVSRLTNEERRKLLTTTVFVSDRENDVSAASFENINTITQAIADKKKIDFQYIDYTPEKEKIYRHDGKMYRVSPYALICDDGRYYLAAYNDEIDAIATYRIDRMGKVIPTDENLTESYAFNPKEFANQALKMFDEGLPPTRIMLECDNKYMINVLDRFGENITTRVLNKKSFSASVKVIPSKAFFSWVFGFGGGIRIKSPDFVRDGYIAMLKDTLKKYEE